LGRVGNALGGRVIVDILDVNVVLLGPSAAETPDETDEQGDGVDDVDKASYGGDAEQEDAGYHQSLGKVCVVHHLGLLESLNVFNHANDHQYETDDTYDRRNELKNDGYQSPAAVLQSTALQ